MDFARRQDAKKTTASVKSTARTCALSSPRWQQVGGNAAESYARHLVPGMLAPWAPKLIYLADVQPGARVLDVACGTGVVTRLVAARVGSAGRVVGLDVNPAMLAVARSLTAVGGAPVEWLEANALHLPLLDAAFHVVLCQQGLQQLPDRLAALREMRGVLAPGSRLGVDAPIGCQAEFEVAMGAATLASNKLYS